MIAATIQTEIDGLRADANLAFGPSPAGSLMMTLTHASLEGADPFGLVDTKAENGIASALTARSIGYTRLSNREFVFTLPSVTGWTVRVTR